MASARFAWGIDVGNRALKAVKLVRTENGFRVDDFEVIEHETVLSNAGDNKEGLIQAALANFVQRHSIRGAVAAVGVSGVSSFSRFIKLPPVEARKIPEIVRFEAIQQIPFPLDDVEWTYQLFQTPDSPEVEVGIFAMRKELINQHIKYFTDVNLNVQAVQTSPLAVYNAMFHDGRLKGTTMIIDLGAENTDLIIADGETIWLRSIPIGGNNLTEVLVKSFKLPFAKAEELKRNAYSSKFAPQILKTMRPVFADLVTEVNRSIGFYASVHRDSRIKKVIALGGTFNLNGLQKYLQQNLQLEVEKLKDLGASAPADAKLAATLNQNVLSMATAYGLAIQAIGEAKIASSLLPAHIRRAKAWKDKTKWFAGAAACFVAGAGLAMGGYYVRNMQWEKNSSIRLDNGVLLKQAQGLSDKWKTEVEGAGKTELDKMSDILSTLSDRTLWPHLISDIVAEVPSLPKEYNPPNKDLIIKTSRENREVLFLNGFTSQYYVDLAREVSSLSAQGSFDPAEGSPKAPAGSGPVTPPVGGGPPPATFPGIPDKARGFIVTFDVTTPNRTSTVFVSGTLVKNLQKLDRTWLDNYNSQKANQFDQKNYYVALVAEPIDKKLLKNDTDKLQNLKISWDALNQLTGQTAAPGGVTPMPIGPPGFIPGGPMVVPGAGPAMPDVAAGEQPWLKDRLTKEDMSNDWSMKVMVVVVIDPPKPPSP